MVMITTNEVSVNYCKQKGLSAQGHLKSTLLIMQKYTVDELLSI